MTASVLRPDPWTRAPTVLERAVSVVLWCVGVAWLVPMMAVMMGVALVVPSDRTDWLNRLYCWGQVRLTGAKWRAVVDPQVDSDTPYIFACNHVNLLDHVTMYNATPHFKQGVELAAHFKIPVYGWFMRQRGTIGVHKGRRDQMERLTADVRAELGRAHSILVFPEGTRTKDGHVGRFRKGFFRISRTVDVPVVPVTVTGMYPILKKGRLLFRWGSEVTVWVDAPMRAREGEDDRAFAERVQAVVAGRVQDWWEGGHG